MFFVIIIFIVFIVIIIVILILIIIISIAMFIANCQVWEGSLNCTRKTGDRVIVKTMMRMMRMVLVMIMIM